MSFSSIVGRSAAWILLLLLIGCSRPRMVVPEPVLPFSHDEPREFAVDQQAKQVLNRFTYGTGPVSADAVLRGGIDHWLVRQLTPEHWEDHGADTVLLHYPVMSMRVADVVEARPPLDLYLRHRRATLGLPDSASYAMTAADSAFKTMSELGSRRVQWRISATDGRMARCSARGSTAARCSVGAPALLSLRLVKMQHSPTYAVTNARELLALYAASLFIDWIGALLAFLLERGQRLELTLLVALQRFVYRRLMYHVVVRSIVAALHGRLVEWGKRERTATVLLDD